MGGRTFFHRYADQFGSTYEPNLELRTTDIAVAALYEITQLSLNATPFNLFLEELLAPGTKRFKWVSQLGQVRETRTALSGLFGRFVARAYLARHKGYAFFEPVRGDIQQLKRWPSLIVRRKAGATGDLPDWIIADRGGASVAIAEAKGTHNASGAAAALKEAKKQVKRVEVVSGTTVLRTKSFAVATRWAVDGNDKLSKPWLLVHDPDEGEREPTDQERMNMARSVALGHFAALAGGFRLPEAAGLLREAMTGEPGRLHVPAYQSLDVETAEASEKMIGAVVVPTGIIPIPIHGDPETFLSAVRTVYGRQSLFFGVDVGTLHAIDQGFFGVAMGAPELDSPEDLFQRSSSHAGNAVTIPLDQVRIRRSTQ